MTSLIIASEYGRLGMLGIELAYFGPIKLCEQNLLICGGKSVAANNTIYLLLGFLLYLGVCENRKNEVLNQSGRGFGTGNH